MKFPSANLLHVHLSSVPVLVVHTLAHVAHGTHFWPACMFATLYVAPVVAHTPLRIINSTAYLLSLQARGGTIVDDDVPRVCGVLAVTRAFGNNTIKSTVNAEPELSTHSVTNELEYVVIASDGVWDVLSNEDVVRFPQILFYAHVRILVLFIDAVHSICWMVLFSST